MRWPHLHRLIAGLTFFLAKLMFLLDRREGSFLLIKVRHFRIFLSSPGDVSLERIRLRSLVETELAKERLFRLGARLEVVSWDDPNAPVPLDAHVTPQEAVDRGLPLPSQCDVVIVLLWSRFGTPLPEAYRKPNGERYWSGTEYEYHDAISANANSRVLIYRCVAPIEDAWRKSVVQETDMQRQEQRARVEHFFAAFKAPDGSPTGSYQTYETVADLENLVRMQLREVLQEKMLGPSHADLGIARIFRARTQAFRDEYLVSETGPVPFGGREKELEFFDTWLHNSGSAPRMLVTAPAGRGKSALLVQWMKTLQDLGVFGPEGWQLVFMPISIRVGTNWPEVFYEGLARRLAEIMAEPLPTESIRDSDGFRYAVRDQLDRIAASGERIILVIDGLDEALHGSFDPAILPSILPPSLRVLVSARWQVGDINSRGWLKRLGWDRGVKVNSIELDPLDYDGITDVLVKLGAPVETLARNRALVRRLLELTGGEPLLVRYYAEDLWDTAGRGVPITQAALDALQPGFGSYFQRWFQFQDALWREEKSGIDGREIDRVLSVLAFAHGPLEEANLLELMEQNYGPSRVISGDRLLEPLRRFVIGTGEPGSGYVLSHPKIGEYLQNDRFSARAAELRSGFMAWGKMHLEYINAGKLRPEQASPYVLQFLPRHLEESGAGPEDYLGMVEDGWRRAWEQFEGGQRGFANAVRITWAILKKDKANLWLGERWRCALTLSSIRSRGWNMRGKLALAAVKRGGLTIRQAAQIAELKNPSKESVTLLAELSVHARKNHAVAADLALLAIDTAWKVPNSADFFGRAEALSAIIKTLFSVDQGLSAEIQRSLRVPVLEAIRALSPLSRVRLLAEIAGLFDGQDKSSIVQEACKLGFSLELLKPHDQAEAFIRLLPILDEPRRSHFTQRTLDLLLTFDQEIEFLNPLGALAPYLSSEQWSTMLASVKAITNTSHRSLALAALAPHLMTEQLPEALGAAKAIDGGDHRSNALAALALRLIPELKHQVLTEALADAIAIGNEVSRSFALAKMAPHLAPDQLSEALIAARAIGDESSRVRALRALALYLAPELRQEVLAEAFATVKMMDKEWDRGLALSSLAPHLTPEQLAEAFSIAKTIRSQIYRSLALAALALHFGPKLFSDALADAMAIKDEAARSRALVMLAALCSPDQKHKILAEAFAAADGCDDEFERSGALAALAPQLPPELRANALAKAFAAAKAVWDEGYRSIALTARARDLTPEQLADALITANSISNEKGRPGVLATLASRLPPDQQQDVIAEAFTAAMSIRDEWRRVNSLGALVAHLAPQQVGQAFVSAVSDRSEYYRSNALYVLAPRLGPEQLAKALAAARTIADSEHRSHALIALAPRLASELRHGVFTEAFAAAVDIKNESRRSVALCSLAPYLSPEQVVVALAAVRQIGVVSTRAMALSALAPYVAPELRQEVIAEALAGDKNITDTEHRLIALTELLPTLPPDKQLDTLLAMIDAAENSPRAQALSAAASGAYATLKFGGQEALLTLWRAISDVCRWYP